MNASKLKKETSDTVLIAIKLGLKDTLAARYAQIDPKTLRNWLEKGEEQKSGVYRDFYNEYHKTVAQRQAGMAKIIMKAAHVDDDWRAAAWYLEHREKGVWSKESKSILKIEDSKDIVNIDDMSFDELKEYKKKLLDEIGNNS